MAVLRQRSPLRQARDSRNQLSKYLQLDGGRYLIVAALLLALVSLLLLGQTGRLATKGYEIGQLEAEKKLLIRQISTTRLELSEAQSLEKIEQRAKELNLRPATADQIQYMTVDVEGHTSMIQGVQTTDPNAEPTSEDEDASE